MQFDKNTQFMVKKGELLKITLSLGRFYHSD